MDNLVFDIETLEVPSQGMNLDEICLDHVAGARGNDMPVAAYTGCSPGTGRYQPC